MTRRALWTRLLGLVAERCVLIVLLLATLTPFVFIVLTALMTDQQSLSPNLWPDPFRPANFVAVFHDVPLLRYTANTMLYAVLATVGVLVSSVPVAYALARYRWRGRHTVLLGVIALMLLPVQVTTVPLYILYNHLGLTGTLVPLIAPKFFGDAFSIFLLRQFLLTIPQDYANAARIDGAGELRTMLRVILPMAKPALSAVALFQFLACWNDFFLPLLYSSENPNAWTLSLGLSAFQNQFSTQWNLVMAATLLFMVPVIAVFFAAQRSFVRGVTLTGVKG